MGQIYGYVRVSTKEQNEDRQLLALEPYEIPRKNIFIDKQSGKDFNRPAYRRMTQKMRRGDLLLVKSIDRLGRDYEEIIEQWKYITKKIGADIRIVDMPLLDTRREKDLLGTFISDLVLQVLSFVSQTERDFIRQRQAEGIAAAKLRGIKFGRPAKELDEEVKEVIDAWRQKLCTAEQAARFLRVSRRMFFYYAKRYKSSEV